VRWGVSRVLTAALLTGTGAVALVPVANASDLALVAAPEGWYQPNPTCAGPLGCLPGPTPVAPPTPIPTSPYPEGTLHVGWSGPAETARTYLAFPLDQVTGQLTGATLDVPLDTASADGDMQSSTAKVQVCLATGTIVDVRGSIDAPPTIDCDLHADLTYVAAPAPHLHGDLQPLLAAASPSFGIVLLPDATKNAATESWRVVFSAHDRTDAAKTAPARLTVTTSPAAADAPPPSVNLSPVNPPAPRGFAAGPSSVIAEAPPTVAPLPAQVAPQTAPIAAPLVRTARTVRFGYAYPVVWLLPLALLIVAPLATRALTKELT
jgi:hypothetical protein